MRKPTQIEWIYSRDSAQLVGNLCDYTHNDVDSGISMFKKNAQKRR